MHVSTVRHVSGATIPGQGTMLVERTALTVMHASPGESVVVKTINGKPQSLNISGIVHDPGLAPAWQQQSGYAYITLSTLKTLDTLQGFNLLRIRVSEHEYSREHIDTKAKEVAGYLQRHGLTVHEIQVPPPGKHPHQSQMTTVLSIFVIFSFVILLLASLLVATSMKTLMIRHTRQIGVMKTIGGTSVQIGGMYVLMMLLLCTTAIIAGIPPGQVSGVRFIYANERFA